MPSSKLHACCAAAVLMALTGCNSSSSISTRSGVATVYTGAYSDTSDCLVANADNCPGFEDAAIADVDHDGDRVAVLITNDQTVTLVLSEDGGATWSTHPLVGDLVSDFGWNQGAVGVHVYAGEIYILYTQDRPGAAGLTYTDLLPLRVDPKTWKLSRAGSDHMPMGIPYKRDNGHIRLTYTDGDPRGGYQFPHFAELDPPTDAITEALGTCTGDACNHTGSWSSPNRGDTFYTFGYTTEDVCLMTAGTSGGATTQQCLALAQWPAPQRSYEYPILFANGVPDQVYAIDGQVYASALAANGAMTTALGDGTIGNYLQVGRFLRPRFGGFQLAEEVSPPMTRAAQGRLVSLDNGPEEVTFPGTPCTDDSDCGYLGASLYGYRLVQWIEPVAADAYLVFWVVQSEASANQQTLYVARLTPTRAPITATVPDWGPLPGYPGIKPMTPIEAQCARYVSCYAGGSMAGDPTGICISHFVNETSFCPGIPAQRDTFLAATDCPSLMAAWPNFGQNDPAAYCPACNGGSNCVPTPPPCDPTPQCVNGAYQQCDSGQNVDIRDRCDLVGLSCTTTSPTPGTLCTSPSPGRAACSQSAPLSVCQGNFLLNCEGNEYHYLDCTTLGYPGCQPRGMTAYCQ